MKGENMLAMIIGFILGVFTYYFFQAQIEAYVVKGLGLMKCLVNKSEEMKPTETDTDKVEPSDTDKK